MAPTKDELEGRVAELERENAELRAAAADPGRTGVTATSKPRPTRPTDDDGNVILSEGERQALEARGVTVSPFTGEEINALDEGVEVKNPEAQERAERARHRSLERSPNEWPISGAPPAEGGDTELEPR